MTDAPTRRKGEGPWARLRRRKVVQWGVAYAAGAWGLLQGIAYFRDTFGWSHELQQVATLLILMGLPVVVVLAWYHGDRGQQRVTASELAALALLCLLGGGAFWIFERGEQSEVADGSEGPAAATTTVSVRPSIAVLPFDNRSDRREDEFFVDGIHDDILTQLSKVSALKVISRTSVEQFRGTTLPMKDIAGQLGVANILEGGVQRAGDRVRINVQLIDAGTDAHLWAETYDRELTAVNIFAIQSEVAAAIAAELKASLTTAERKNVNAIPTQNLAAWEAYQLGRQRMARRTSAGLADAVEFFRKAIDSDPAFALASAGLSDALALQVNYEVAPRLPTLARARAAAAEALRLDPGLAEAWTSSGFIAGELQEYDRAEEMYRRAITLNPNYATAHHWYGQMLAEMGRLDESQRHLERALALDPLSAIINKNLAETLEARGRFDQAEARYRKSIEIDPSMPGPYLQFGNMQSYGLGRFDLAEPWIARAVAIDPGLATARAGLAILYLEVGNDADADRSIDAAMQRGSGIPLVQDVSALVRLYRGDEAAALERARKAVDTYPRDSLGLVLLRNADLKTGNVAAARGRYAKAYPELVSAEPPSVDMSNWTVAIQIALVLRESGETDRATELLDRSEEAIAGRARLGLSGFGVADVRIHALRGDTTKALTALREAKNAGWRGPFWRYYRDFDPELASLRGEPAFRAVFAEIERDVVAQRARMADRSGETAPTVLSPDIQ